MRTLTPRILGEILQHEGLAREAYRDCVGVWTWSVGITDASGHRVARYRDNPQTIERCLEVFVWLLTTRYLPAIISAFGAAESSGTATDAEIPEVAPTPPKMSWFERLFE